MTTRPENNDDESFIILGTSPGNSMELKYNGVSSRPLNKADIEDAMKDLPPEANMAFKAHFKLGDCPSPASMMAASTIIADDKTTEELQKRFGEILDENVILKESLKQNNESMKEQFLLIASCQEDMLQTHKMHKEKFDETRALIEKLRQENKQLKTDIVRLAENQSLSHTPSNPLSDKPDSMTRSMQSDKLSGIEFVTSPDDDMVNKLTSQLGLVEKQRRQVIVENEKLTWQKESLEKIVDMTTKERDELKEKLKAIELDNSNKEERYIAEINKLKCIVEDLQLKVQTSSGASGISNEEIKQRDSMISALESKVLSLYDELKSKQLKILELENVKLEFSMQKAGSAEIIKTYKEQVQDLHNRLKQAQTTVFQPVRFSMSVDTDSSLSEFSSFVNNVKLYDRTLKHLSELLNNITNGTSECLVDTIGLITSLYEYKLERTTADNVKSGLGEVKLVLEQQHTSALNNIGQIRSTLSIFEGIFQEYKEILKKGLTKTEEPQSPSSTANVEALTTALVARGRELQTAQSELSTLRASEVQANEDIQLLKAQVELYKSDFEAERESRQKMACEKDSLATELRLAQKKSQELIQQLKEVKKLNPLVYNMAMEKRRTSASGPASPATTAASRGNVTGNMVRKKKIATSSKKADSTEDKAQKEESPEPPKLFVCPVCDKSLRSLKMLQDHVDNCLL